MTGACTNGSVLYFFGKDYYSQYVTQQFSTGGSTSTVYMDHFPGLGTAYDTAWLSGGMWIARDDSDSPILAYDTDGLCVGWVEGTVVSAAMGLTMDDSDYLWASNPDDDTIYQLSVTTGVAEGATSGLDPQTVSVSENPFRSSVVITGTGFTEAVLDIFDVCGRRIESSPFSGSYTWDASDAPAGAYLARIRDAEGSATVRMVRIR